MDPRREDGQERQREKERGLVGGSGTAKAGKLLSRWCFESSLKLVPKKKKKSLFMRCTESKLTDRRALIFHRLLRECAARLANSPQKGGLGPGHPKLSASSPPRNVDDKDEQRNRGRQRGEKRRSCLKIQKDLMPKWIQQRREGTTLKGGRGSTMKSKPPGFFCGPPINPSSIFI